MKDIESKSENGHPYWSYDEVIASFEVEVLLRVDDKDYQGDTRLLLRDGDRYGLTTFGWGSCSGCDALEAANTVQEVTELRDRLWNDVHWEDTAAGLLVYINGKDWELDYAWSADETKQFLDGARTVLSGVSA